MPHCLLQLFTTCIIEYNKARITHVRYNRFKLATVFSSITGVKLNRGDINIIVKTRKSLTKWLCIVFAPRLLHKISSHNFRVMMQLWNKIIGCVTGFLPCMICNNCQFDVHHESKPFTIVKSELIHSYIKTV